MSQELEDALNDLIKSTERENIKDSALMLPSDGKIAKFFDYELDVTSNKLSIQLNPLSVSQFGKVILPSEMHSDIGDMASGKKSIPEVSMEFDAEGTIKLAKLFCIPVYDNKGLKEHLHIHQHDNRTEYTNNPYEVIDRIKELSDLKTGSYDEIQKDLSQKIIILRDNVFDSQPNQGFSPLGKNGDLYRLNDNNQLVSIKQKIGGPEVAFQYAAQVAMANHGINTGTSKIFRMPDKSASEFVMVEDSLNEKLLPAATFGSAHGYHGLKKTNESKKIGVDYRHYVGTENSHLDSDGDRSLARLMYDNPSGTLDKNILTASIFNKLLGAKNINANSVNFYMDITECEKTGERKIVQEIDMGNSFKPDFSTKDPMLSGKAPEDLTIQDVAKSSEAFHSLYEASPEAFEECFNKAIEIRNDMQKIISFDLVEQQVLKVEETMQFDEYLSYSQGAFPGFEKTREQELGDPENLISINLSNKQGFMDRARDKNKSTDIDNDNAINY